MPKAKKVKEAGKSISNSFSKEEFLFIMAITGGIVFLILYRLGFLSFGN